MLCDGRGRSGSAFRASAKRWGVLGLLGQQHLDQAEFGGAARADQLFFARPYPRHDKSRLVEGEDLAIGVVAAHGNDRLRAGDQLFHAVVELDDPDMGYLRALLDAACAASWPACRGQARSAPCAARRDPAGRRGSRHGSGRRRRRRRRWLQECSRLPAGGRAFRRATGFAEGNRRTSSWPGLAGGTSSPVSGS